MALQKETVVATALTLLEEVGVEGLTMRALAKALNVQAPTLYWHFPSKQDLLDKIADAIIAPAVAATDTSQDPDAVLSSLARAMRNALLAHRDGAKVYAGAYAVGANVLKLADIALEALLKKQLDEQAATDAMFNLVYFVLGSTIEEQAFRERWRSDEDHSGGEKQLMAAIDTRFPALRRCAGAIIESDFETQFKEGVAAFLRGLEGADAVGGSRS